jgi:hypothetical protein
MREESALLSNYWGMGVETVKIEVLGRVLYNKNEINKTS